MTALEWKLILGDEEPGTVVSREDDCVQIEAIMATGECSVVVILHPALFPALRQMMDRAERLPGQADWAHDPRVVISERDEGQFFAYLGNEMCGPYPDVASARADLPPTSPARGPYCGCGFFGSHDESHSTGEES